MKRIITAALAAFIATTAKADMPGWDLVSDASDDYEVYEQIEGYRAFLRVSVAGGILYHDTFTDYDCAGKTYRDEDGTTGSVYDFAPDTIGRQQYHRVCGDQP